MRNDGRGEREGGPETWKFEGVLLAKVASAMQPEDFRPIAIILLLHKLVGQTMWVRNKREICRDAHVVDQSTSVDISRTTRPFNPFLLP